MKVMGESNIGIAECIGVLGVLNVLNVHDVLNVLNMPMDASSACWALLI